MLCPHPSAPFSGFMAPAMPSSSKVSHSKVAMSAVVDEVMDKLKSMTLLEASELVKAIEETFDVDASAGGGGMMMAMAPGAVGGGEAAGAAAEEKTEFDLVLESFPADKKIAVLKVVRGITGLGLKEAKEMVEAAPKVLKEGAGKEECEDAKKQLEEAGAVAALK
jgi:large subunit ribosomal protein L7/L12